MVTYLEHLEVLRSWKTSSGKCLLHTAAWNKQQTSNYLKLFSWMWRFLALHLHSVSVSTVLELYILLHLSSTQMSTFHTLHTLWNLSNGMNLLEISSISHRVLIYCILLGGYNYKDIYLPVTLNFPQGTNILHTSRRIQFQGYLFASDIKFPTGY